MKVNRRTIEESNNERGSERADYQNNNSRTLTLFFISENHIQHISNF